MKTIEQLKTQQRLGIVPPRGGRSPRERAPDRGNFRDDAPEPLHTERTCTSRGQHLQT